MTDYEKTGDYVVAKRMELACSNLQHLMKIQDEQITLEAIVNSLEQTLADAEYAKPYDLNEMLVVHARILDATFHYYLNQAPGKYSSDEKIDRALKAQSQAVRTIHVWNRMQISQKRRTN